MAKIIDLKTERKKYPVEGELNPFRDRVEEAKEAIDEFEQDKISFEELVAPIAEQALADAKPREKKWGKIYEFSKKSKN